MILSSWQPTSIAMCKYQAAPKKELLFTVPNGKIGSLPKVLLQTNWGQFTRKSGCPARSHSTNSLFSNMLTLSVKMYELSLNSQGLLTALSLSHLYLVKTLSYSASDWPTKLMKATNRRQN